MTRSVAKSPHVAEQCDDNIHSLTQALMLLMDHLERLIHISSLEAQSLHAGIVLKFGEVQNPEVPHPGALFRLGMLGTCLGCQRFGGVRLGAGGMLLVRRRGRGGTPPDSAELPGAVSQGTPGT
ncbi:hypothetical protein TNCV_1907781 [Trichonephila clavipes]|nr:hypothetical protein TNCV_1907781 [Trichonephila clavipes]